MMVTQGAAAEDSFTGLADDLVRALDVESALTQRLGDLRSRRASLDDQLRRAREEASSSTITEARREIEALVSAVEDRARTAEYDAAEQAARSGAERRALAARLERIEASCDELLAAVQRLAETAREPTIIIDDRIAPAPIRRRRQRFDRSRRTSAARRARVDQAISDRISRVMAPSTDVTTVEAEAVEERIRNMSHGTNGQ